MKARKIPRGTFLLGGVTAVCVTLPLLDYALFGLAQHFAIGSAEPLEKIAMISLLFAGVPTLFAGGGVARLVAHRLAEHDVRLGRGIKIGAFAMAFTGLAAAILTTVPLGLPEHRSRWAPLWAAGVLPGVIAGIMIGVLVTMRQKRHAARATPQEAVS